MSRSPHGFKQEASHADNSNCYITVVPGQLKPRIGSKSQIRDDR